MNKRDKLLVALSPFILLAGWGLAYEVHVILRDRAIVRAKQEHRLAEINSIKEFAAHTNAIVDWQKTLCNGDTDAHLFSAFLDIAVPGLRMQAFDIGRFCDRILDRPCLPGVGKHARIAGAGTDDDGFAGAYH